MAGHRRTTGGGRATQREMRAGRRRQALIARLGVAQTPEERLHAAWVYARGAVRTAAPKVAEAAIGRAVAALTAVGDDLLAPERKGGSK